jgi:p21-activated kinase 1
MEFMEGGTLEDATKSIPFQEKDIAFVVSQLLLGLSYLHANNYVYRDMKTSNVMLSVGGEVKLSKSAFAFVR